MYIYNKHGYRAMSQAQPRRGCTGFGFTANAKGHCKCIVEHQKSSSSFNGDGVDLSVSVLFKLDWGSNLEGLGKVEQGESQERG